MDKVLGFALIFCIVLMKLHSRVDLTNGLGHLPYNSNFRYQRKITAREIGNKRAASNYDKWIEVEARRLLLRLLENPDDIVHHIEKYASFTPELLRRD